MVTSILACKNVINTLKVKGMSSLFSQNVGRYNRNLSVCLLYKKWDLMGHKNVKKNPATVKATTCWTAVEHSQSNSVVSFNGQLRGLHHHLSIAQLTIGEFNLSFM